MHIAACIIYLISVTRHTQILYCKLDDHVKLAPKHANVHYIQVRRTSFASLNTYLCTHMFSYTCSRSLSSVEAKPMCFRSTICIHTHCVDCALLPLCTCKLKHSSSSTEMHSTMSIDKAKTQNVYKHYIHSLMNACSSPLHSVLLGSVL
jgi:hypothetical protein